MAGIAVVVAWPPDPQAPRRVARMLDRVPHRGSARQVLAAEGGACLGWVGPATDLPPGTVAAPDGLVCVADLRLDHRDEAAALLVDGDRLFPTDLKVLQPGYRRWGKALPEHLSGDFAFVLWDPQRRSLFAARDAFGVRPLYYRRDPNGLALASEVEQLLPETGAELEAGVVLDYFLGEHRLPRETFFTGIFRLRPGHWLEATPEHFREERWWQPPSRPFRTRNGRDGVGEFRHRFRRAVVERLGGTRPVVAQLSGGLDSSSIVCTAADIVARREVGALGLVACSAVYPDLECDEQKYIQTVVQRTGVAWRGWNGSDVPDLAAAGSCLSQPWAGTAPGSLEGDFCLAQEIGAEAILSGFGGDQLLFERGVFRDLAANGRWLELLHQALLAPRYSSHSAAFFLRDALRGTGPTWLLQLYRRLRRRRPPAPPGWLGPALRSAFGSCVAEEQAIPPGWSHAGWANWQWLTSPSLWWSLELQTLRAARAGLEVRYPFLDRALADLVLALPYEDRLPAGRMKLLLRRAMTGLLPPRVAGGQA